MSDIASGGSAGGGRRADGGAERFGMMLNMDDVTWERDRHGDEVELSRGYGTVHAGTLRGQQVAIMSEEFRWGGAEEWMDMMRMQYNMTCPHIVSVHGVIVDRHGDTGTKYHLVMERMAGSLAQQMLYPGSPYAGAGMGLRLQLLADVASGLTYLHAGGLIHADVKPDNVMLTPVTPRCPFPVAKLADFGSSVARDADADELMGPRGTPIYMDPCLLDDGATTASDVYSFGVMAWQVLTGSMPYEAEMAAAMPATASAPQVLEALRRRWWSVVCRAT